MSKLELKIPPPLLMLITAALMLVASLMFARIFIPHHIKFLLVGLFILLGVFISGIAFVQFRRASTTVNPMQPDKASQLLTSGIFTFSRNPMYVGLMCFLIAWGITLSSIVALFLVVLFVLYMNRFQIIPEERVLSTKFGQEYTQYMQRVRRWI